MITEMLEKMILKLSLDPTVLAIMIETTAGLSLALLIGQIIAFKKYIKLREPGYQIFSFFFSKFFGFFVSLIKSFGLVLLGYTLIIAGGYFIDENLIATQYRFVVGGYVFALVVFFGFGFSKERTRSLAENMMTKGSEA